MRKVTLIIQAIAFVILVAVAMLAHSRHQTAPAVIRFGTPSHAVDIERSTPETGRKGRLKPRVLRPPMLAFASNMGPQSRV